MSSDYENNEPSLREQVLRNAPQPSAAHDELVMHAARVRAAAQRRSRQRRARYRGLLALAASIVVAVGVWQVVPVDVADESVMRNDADSLAWPSGNATLEALPAAFHWQAPPGARRFRVTLYDDAAQELWQSEWLDAPRMATSMLQAALPNTEARYFWVVELDGTTTRQSLGPFWFRLE